MKVISKQDIKKILIIRFKGLGDIMLSMPAVKALKKSYPSASISMLINREAEQIVSGITYVDEIMLHNRMIHGGISGSIRLISEIRKKKFDLVLDLYGNPRSALITILSKAKYRVGTNHRIRQKAYNIKVPGPEEIIYGAKVHLLAAQAAGADISESDTALDLNIPAEAKESMDSYFFKNNIKKGELIGVNPFANWDTKSWGKKKFAEVADKLIESGKKVIVLCGPGEDKSGFAGLMRNKPLIAPETNIKRLAYLLQNLKAVLTNDTVVKHLAVAVKTPTFTIYGATNPKAWEPEGNPMHRFITSSKDCVPCDRTECDDFICMDSITPEIVLEGLKKLI
ncbi:MAG: glycosyltransferase family 9 protein [Candidatus Firestonebacteria bacterium]